MNELNLNKKAILLSLILLLLFIVHALMLNASYGGGDGIRHYVVSRFSWQHHEQFLYHWGKPFFTLISSPFSQFGLIGIKIFNALAAGITAFLSFKIAVKLGYDKPLYAIIFSSLSPVYILCVDSGLTEPLFSLILILSIYLFLDRRYFLACVILSFLPFVRSEGNMILVLFAIVLIYRKKIILIPLLALGTLVYSIIGYFFYNDFFWVKNQNPYNNMNSDIYGHGELLHFVKSYDLILGLPITIFFVAGIIWILIRIFKSPKLFLNENTNHFEELFLVFGSFVLYFVAHSIFWWKGIFGSLGLERAIAGAVPCAGIIALRGLEILTYPLKNKLSIRNMVYAFFTLAIILYPELKHYIPMQLEEEEKVVKVAAEWYQTSDYKNEKVYYLYQYFTPLFNLDPFDGKRVGELWGLYPAIKAWGIDGPVPLNTIILYDTHFGPNEARIPFDSIMNDPNFKLIKTFKPEHPIKTLGDNDFAIYAFLRVKSKIEVAISNESFDLENLENLGNINTINEFKPLSGKHSSQMKKENEFGVLYERQISQFINYTSIQQIAYSANIYTNVPPQNLIAVMSIDNPNGGKSIQWEGKEIIMNEKGKWEKINVKFNVDQSALISNRKLKIYLWNKGKNEFFVDDITVNIIGFK